MVFDYSRLKGRIAEKGLSQRRIADAIHCDAQHLNRQLNGRYSLRQEEIVAMCGILDIDATEIGAYFFTPQVAKKQLKRNGK